MQRLNGSRIGAVVADAFAVRASTSTLSTLHAAHGASIVVGLTSDVTVTEATGSIVRGPVVVVPPDYPHGVGCPGPVLGFLFDPEAAPHVAAFARSRRKPHVLDAGLSGSLRAAITAHGASLSRPDVLDGVARELAAWIARDYPPRVFRPDRRVARALEALRDPSDSAPNEGSIVARAAISPSHLQRLFVRDVGVPMRTFRLWRRLLVGVAALSRGDATRAAHAAGFADLAHFSRTCRRMLGYSPTALSSRLLGDPALCGAGRQGAGP